MLASQEGAVVQTRSVPPSLLAAPILGVALVLGGSVQVAGHPSELLRPIAAVAIVGSALSLVVWVIGRNALVAAWLGSIVVAWLVSREFAIVPLGVGFGVIAWLHWQRLRGAPRRVSNVFVLSPPMAICGVALFQLVSIGVISPADLKTPPPGTHEAAAGTGQPSIYVLLLDGYPRADELTELGIDNKPFIDSLAQLGLKTNPRASSAFNGTSLSLASSMLADPSMVEEYPDAGLWERMRALRRQYLVNVPTMDRLREAGYRLDYIASDVGLSEWRGWDTTYDSGYLTNTEALLIQRSPLAPLLGGWVTDQLRARAESSLAAWGSSADGAQKVSFAHVVPPHAPFLWGPDGEGIPPGECWYARTCSLYTVIADELDMTREEFTEHMRWQLAALNDRVLDAVERVVDADPDGIALVMSDHGARYEPFSEEAHHTFLAARNAPPLDGPDGLFIRLLEYVAD